MATAMDNRRIVYKLFRTQGAVKTELTDSYDLPAIERLRDQMNENAPEGISYSVVAMEITTRPLTVLPALEVE